MSTTLLPHGLAAHEFNALLAKTNANVLIAEAGSVQLESALAGSPSIKHVIWVVKAGNRHMEWAGSEGAPESVAVSSWHEIVEKGQATASAEIPPYDKDSPVPAVGLSTFASSASDSGYELVEYSVQVSSRLFTSTICYFSCLV